MMDQLIKLIFALMIFILLGAFINLGIILQRRSLERRYLHCRNIAVWLGFMLLACNSFSFGAYEYLAGKIIDLSMLEGFWDSIRPLQNEALFSRFQYFIVCNYLLMISAVIVFAATNLLFVRAKRFIDISNRSGICRMIHFPWILAELFYEEDEEEDGKYRLNPRGNVSGMWSGWMVWILFLVILVEMLPYLAAFGTKSGWINERAVNVASSIYFVPVCLLILMEQIHFFLEGNEEYEVSGFQSDEIGYVRQGGLETLVDDYKTSFSQTDALLNSYVQQQKQDQIQIHNDLTASQSEDCEQPEILHILNQQLTDAGVATVGSFQNALSYLLNGKSINIRDHIQGEFLSYLAVYMSFYISQGKTFLVLCKNHRKAKLICKEMDRALKRINKFAGIWKCSDIEDADSNRSMNILVCGYQDLVSHSLLNKRPDFFEALMGCVLTDGLEFCAQGNVQKELIFTELRRVQRNLLYVLFSDEDNDSLRTAFEAFTGKEICSFHHDEFPSQVSIMVWKEESYHKIQRCLGIGDVEDPYLGVSIPLALVGIKAGLPDVQVIAGERKGYLTYFDNMKMSSQEITRYMGANYAVENMIRYNQFRINGSSELEMLVLYDSEFNYYNCFWSWLKYGGKVATLVHIVSPPYMLREYMAANMNTMLARNNAFDALIPYQSILDRSRYLALLLDLSNKGMDDDELQMKVLEYNWNVDSTEQLLEMCLKGILNTREYYNIYECFQFNEVGEFDPAGNEYVRHTHIKLTDENIRKRIQSKLIFASMVEKKNVVEELPILKSNIYNYYLRGQIVPIGGYMQRIVNISDKRVFVEQAAAVNRLDYYQTSEFEITDLKKRDDSLNLELLHSGLYTGRVKRKIYGYWESNNGIDFSDPGMMNYVSVKDMNNQTICMDMEDVNIMKLSLKKEVFGEKQQEAVNLAAFMMQEVFKVLFPYSYMNLFAVIDYDPGDGYWEKMINETDSCSYEERVHSILPFIRKTDDENQDPGFLDIYIIEFSALEMGMISMLHNNMKKMFRIMMLYLHWYLGKQKAKPQKQKKEDSKTAAGAVSDAALKASAFLAELLSDGKKEKTEIKAETEDTDVSSAAENPESAENTAEMQPSVTAETAENQDETDPEAAEEEIQLPETAETQENTEPVAAEEEIQLSETAETQENTEPVAAAEKMQLPEIAEKQEKTESAEAAEEIQLPEISEDAEKPEITEAEAAEAETEAGSGTADSEIPEPESENVKGSENHNGKFADFISDIINEVEETRLNDEYGCAEDSTVVPCYLNLGGRKVSPCFAPDEWYGFLKRILADYQELKTRKQYYSYSRHSNECSFCGRKTLIIDVMDDGRRICSNCREHQVSQREEVMKVYKETVQMLEDVYNIEIKDNIKVQMKSAKAIRQETGVSSNARVLGFYRHKSHELWIEARGPRNSVRDTMIHELTHAWQYCNLDMQKLDILESQQKGARLLLLEGHASYMEIDAMRRFGEERYADMLEGQLLRRDDEYGQGYRILKAYFEDLASKGSYMTPFKAMEELVNSTTKRRGWKVKMRKK
ncbi:MAG: hypothetical protein SO101_09085 [Lachnospiraceae bacterium]|nr:hypothetical protein [Lachnospiraceae bacterium]